MYLGLKSLLVPYFGQPEEHRMIDFVCSIAPEMGTHISVVYMSRILKELGVEQRKGYQLRYKSEGFKSAMVYLDELYQSQLKSDADNVRIVIAKRFEDENIPEFQAGDPMGVDSINYSWDQSLAMNADMSVVLTNRAIVSDLVVISASALEVGGQRDPLMEVIRDSGRPLIIVPSGKGISVSGPRRIIIGWKKTAHTVRAMTAALPLLRAAHEVLVLEIAESNISNDNDVSHSDVVQWLLRHGVKAESTRRVDLSGNAETVFDEEMDRFQADLLVVGAYSRWRMREIIFGGFTQHLLSTMRVPTLFSY